MPSMDTRHWRRAGFIPAGDAARALGVAPVALHRAMDVGRVPFEKQGVYRFIRYRDLVAYVRSFITDEVVQDMVIERLRKARKVSSDRGSRKRTA